MKIEDHKITYFCLHDFKKFKVLLKSGRKETTLEAGQAEKGIVWQ
jgi:hypothetical protein